MAWKQESNGTVEAIAVTGDAAAAIAALRPVAGLRMGEVSAADALAVMAWAAASGGAHGRRRGMAYGRFSAWWAVAAVAGRLDDWPFRPDDLGAAAEGLRWYRWADGDGDSATGWSLLPGGGGRAPGSGVGGASHRPRLSPSRDHAGQLSRAGPGRPHPGTASCGRSRSTAPGG